MSLKMTDEQRNIVNALKYYDKIKVFAYAGSGKTTTLKFLTETYPNLKFLYLAFNRSIANEAQEKFPSNTTVKTVHSLAFQFYKKRLSFNKEIGNLKATDLKEILDVNMPFLSKYFDANFIKICFDNFCYSKEQELNENVIRRLILKDAELRHIFNKLNTEEKNSLIEKTTYYCQQLWDKMLNNEIKITHNFYLKWFELNLDRLRKQIYFDVVLLDEAQDTNDVTLSIFEKLGSLKKVMVGDVYQKIYGFRKAINAMENWEADIDLNLTVSFRFNEEIAKRANLLLKKFRLEKKLIKTLSKKEDNFKIENTAYITRTNARLIEISKNLLDKNQVFNTVRDAYEIFKLPLNILWFNLGISSKIKEKWLLKFKDIAEIKDYAETINDIELISALSLYKKYGTEIEKIYQEVIEMNKNKANIFLTTAHTSKGLEWDKVIIEDDFPDWVELFSSAKIKSIKDFNERIKRKDFISLDIMEELNLFYVAITRAKKILINKSANKNYLYMETEDFEDLVEMAIKKEKKETFVEETKKEKDEINNKNLLKKIFENLGVSTKVCKNNSINFRRWTLWKKKLT